MGVLVQVFRGSCSKGSNDDWILGWDTEKIEKKLNLICVAAYSGNLTLFQDICDFLAKNKYDRHIILSRGAEGHSKIFDFIYPTPLEIASRFGNFEVCKFILDKQEEKNPDVAKWGTVLHVGKSIFLFKI